MELANRTVVEWKSFFKKNPATEKKVKKEEKVDLNKLK